VKDCFKIKGKEGSGRGMKAWGLNRPKRMGKRVKAMKVFSFPTFLLPF
jgi:hypothetical protein